MKMINLHVNEISLLYKRMVTKARHEKEAKGNSEMTYLARVSSVLFSLEVCEKAITCTKERSLGSRMCNMRGSRMTSSRVPHVPRDDYWERATRKGKHWISSVSCYAVLDYINSFWFCFWTFNATERRLSSFLWIPRTLFVRSQIMSRNSEMTWIAHEHNLFYTVSR